MQELWFLHSAHPLMLLDICMKFHATRLNGLKGIEQKNEKSALASQIVSCIPPVCRIRLVSRLFNQIWIHFERSLRVLA